MKEFGIALVGGLTAAVIGVAAQYFIAYKLIEEPKILIEKKKISIEAQKQMASLTPNLDTECSSSVSDKFTWQIFCTNKNSGQYSSEVSIAEVDIVGDAERESVIYNEMPGSFKISYPENKKAYRSFPATNSTLNFHINLDNKKFPFGLSRTDLSARVTYKYTTTNSTIKFFLNEFPELEEAIADNTTRYMKIYITLPPTNLGNFKENSIRSTPTVN